MVGEERVRKPKDVRDEAEEAGARVKYGGRQLPRASCGPTAERWEPGDIRP